MSAAYWEDDYDGDRLEEYEDDPEDADDEEDDYYEPQAAFLDLGRL